MTPNLQRDSSIEPFASIVIPAFNAADTLERAIRSVLSQEGAAFEVIVIDDGSSDSTLDLAAHFAKEDSRLVVFAQRNGGTAGALNAGLARARGRFVAALGADDELSREYLVTMNAFVVDHPGYDIYSHDCWVLAPNGTRSRYLGWDDVRSATLDDLLRECVILGGGTLVSRELLIGIGGYRPEAYNEDYDLWLRALAEGARHLYCPEPLYYYYLSPQSQKTGQGLAMYASAATMFRELVERYPLTPAQVALAEEATAKFSGYVAEIEDLGVLSSQLTQGWAQASRARLARVLGHVLPDDVVQRLLTTLSRSTLLSGVRQLWWRARLWLLRRIARRGGVHGS